MVCTIDPDDAKDYDDAISLRKLPNDELGAGRAHRRREPLRPGRQPPMDVEASHAATAATSPGHVIPMLPEVLSNGVCSLQEGVARLCKSAFIRYDEDAKPIGTKFANTVIHSDKRLRLPGGAGDPG